MTAADQQGVQFPLTDDGERRTMPTNRAVWADAARVIDAVLAAEIDVSTRWRREYVRFVRSVTELGARSADASSQVAEAGVASARGRFVFRRHGTDHALCVAAALAPAFGLKTETIDGTGVRERALVVPYRGERLRDGALRRQIERWTEQGIIEPSAGEALRCVMEHSDWLSLAGRRVVLLGAGAETSPLEVLSSWGAEIVVIDLARPALWQRLLDISRRGAGQVHVPLRSGEGALEARAGANLITEVPEIAAWLLGFAEDRPLTLAFYIYADGGLHVQATMAADAVADHLLTAGNEVAVAYAGTPSDCYLVSSDLVEDSAERRRHLGVRRLWEQPARLLSGGRLYADAYRDVLTGEDGEPWTVADALVSQQGPNYALAKRLQRWRAVEAWRHDRPASFNVAPPTWTASVTKNRLLAAGYYGAKYVGMEIFEPDTMRSLMAALMVHDIHNPPTARHPDARIAHGAIHGGYWRRPYEIRSTLLYTAALGLPETYAPVMHIR
jgi:hypothetical protein